MKKTEFEKIPADVVQQYNIENDTDTGCVSIHSPSYINVDDPVKIKINKTMVELKNDRVCVALWRNIYNMHTTVY